MFSKFFKKQLKPSPAFEGLRNMMLTQNPAEVGIQPTDANSMVWGVLMDMGMPNGTATIVSLVDGTSSLYTSTGGGILGSGEHPPVAEASRALVALAERYFESMIQTASYPLPSQGHIKFYVMTYIGVFTHQEVSISALERDFHMLSPLFHSADAVLTQIRLHSPS